MHSPASPSPPTPRQIDDALAVVHSPARFHNQPALRATAWEKLKHQRGQTVNLDRISELQDDLRRAHLRLVDDSACREVAEILTLRQLTERGEPVPEAPFWDDVDHSQFDHGHYTPDFGGAA